jgi:hypothetical protein
MIIIVTIMIMLVTIKKNYLVIHWYKIVGSSPATSKKKFTGIKLRTAKNELNLSTTLIR